MGAYAAAGKRGDALRQFLACRRALVEELGIEPEAETLSRSSAESWPAPDRREDFVTPRCYSSRRC